MTDIFKPTDWTVQQLVDGIGSGTLRLPDLQRPFVWPKTKVRDLLDSMYRGYPVGELMFWNRTSDDESGAIGIGAKQQEGTHRIVDGQQRITSLYVAVTGSPVVDDDYKRKDIRISFNPFTERFEVAQTPLDNSAEWVRAVSDVFKSPLKAHNDFVARYEAKHGLMTPDQQEQVHDALIRLDGLKARTFKVVEILSSVEKTVVADIFVRINSEGVNLTSSDFILTWLSVFWPEGRESMEEFARNSRMTAERIAEVTGKKTDWTPKNHYMAPNPGQLVRVAVALGQNRGRLQDAYAALRAIDRKTGAVDALRQAEELEKIKSAVPSMLKPLNWDEFLRVLAAAGFRSRKMVTSDTTILYTYVLWLLGRERYQVDLTTLRTLLARWFFMAQITRRYSGSYESRIQQDLDRLDGTSGAEGFVSVLEGAINTALTADFWAIRLPDDLITSSTAASPAYQGYLAALNILDADLFMLHSKIRDWTDPTATSVKNVEGHHLFPKGYLKKAGYSDLKKINQVANFAPTDWVTNQLISDHPPVEYWERLVADRNFPPDLLARQRYWHAIPEGWTELGYEDFLDARRRLIAAVVRDGYAKLTDTSFSPDLNPAAVLDDPVHSLSLGELMTAGLIRPGDVIGPVDPESSIVAEITEDAEIRLNDKIYDSPQLAAAAAGDDGIDGWDFWAIYAGDDVTPLRRLAETLQSSPTSETLQSSPTSPTMAVATDRSR